MSRVDFTLQHESIRRLSSRESRKGWGVGTSTRTVTPSTIGSSSLSKMVEALGHPLVQPSPARIELLSATCECQCPEIGTQCRRFLQGSPDFTGSNFVWMESQGNCEDWPKLRHSHTATKQQQKKHCSWIVTGPSQSITDFDILWQIYHNLWQIFNCDQFFGHNFQIFRHNLARTLCVCHSITNITLSSKIRQNKTFCL